jgi:hypothetical protein
LSALHVVQTGSGPIQAPVHWVTEALPPELNYPGREAYHSLPTKAEVKNMPIRLRGVALNYLYIYVCVCVSVCVCLR